MKRTTSSQTNDMAGRKNRAKTRRGSEIDWALSLTQQWVIDGVANNCNFKRSTPQTSGDARIELSESSLNDDDGIQRRTKEQKLHDVNLSFHPTDFTYNFSNDIKSRKASTSIVWIWLSWRFLDERKEMNETKLFASNCELLRRWSAILCLPENGCVFSAR